MSSKFCRRIELDYDNERIFRKMYPFVSGKIFGGIKQIKFESVHECVARARGGREAQYRYIGTRYVYRVENENEFLLLLIETGINFKEVNPNSYSMSDEF